MIPLMFKRHKRPGALNIGFTMWEATRLPAVWTNLCNDMDAIFVPCHWNREVFENSGVTVPIFVVQPGVNDDNLPKIGEKIPSKDYRFYSIFQWTERKNPAALLKAYFTTFAGIEDVSLTIKTYKHHINNGLTIEKEIKKVQDEIRLSPGKKFPKVEIIRGFLTRDEVDQIHRTHDCFVSAHCSEAWGLSLMDAMSHGNPVIATKYSGNLDYQNDSNSFLTSHRMAPVSGMGQYAPWFFADTMSWADVDLYSLMDGMKAAYDNRQHFIEMGEAGRKTVVNGFNNSSSSEQLIAAIEELRGRKEWINRK
jgi:glycosyltransferase involved in cell wall biosynthesis